MHEKHSSDRNYPLLTISPKTGLILLLLEGNIIPFADLKHVEIFVQHLTGELDGLKNFAGHSTGGPIEEDYARDVITSWEEQLKHTDSNLPKGGTKTTEADGDIPNESSPCTKANIKIEEKDNSMFVNPLLEQIEDAEQAATLESNNKVNRDVVAPQRRVDRAKSKNRVSRLKRHSSFEVPEDFDPDELSWVLPRVAITDWEGGLSAKRLNHYVINVAGEISSDANAKIPVEPELDVHQTRKTVDHVANLIDKVLQETDRKVVVHCAMGMERSVLCVAWYMHKYLGISIDEAYQQIGAVRPIAADRRHWVGM
jgi:hypothetical protein